MNTNEFYYVDAEKISKIRLLHDSGIIELSTSCNQYKEGDILKFSASARYFLVVGVKGNCCYLAEWEKQEVKPVTTDNRPAEVGDVVEYSIKHSGIDWQKRFEHEVSKSSILVGLLEGQEIGGCNLAYLYRLDKIVSRKSDEDTFYTSLKAQGFQDDDVITVSGLDTSEVVTVGSFKKDFSTPSEGNSKESVKDYASFLSDFKANLLGTDEVVSYLQDNTDMDAGFVDKVRYHEVSKEEIIKVLEENLDE